MPFDASEFSNEFGPGPRFSRVSRLLRAVGDMVIRVDRMIVSLLHSFARAYFEGVAAYCVTVHGCPPGLLTADIHAAVGSHGATSADCHTAESS
jgi:hypothetical protein